jgi:DNA-binding transcriptional LysR family regulator
MDIEKYEFPPRRRARPQSLTIGGTYNPSAKHLPSAIAAFQKTHPDVKVKFLTAHGPNIDKLVRESEVDIAITQTTQLRRYKGQCRLAVRNPRRRESRCARKNGVRDLVLQSDRGRYQKEGSQNSEVCRFSKAGGKQLHCVRQEQAALVCCQ